ncbi:hypothetical protein TRFO_18123 [Tritrichomonas foetus]|uniref:Uncharacterized protein n=1 Tax=Tritrichomonas foetus TaxID=1144522 RepID=A0A1J4KM45_9EUKA|nr:hypothetical protein TRFO_18123 [Tritrichomonas foetus]|eukprot:OHT12210.1 hypothetical protein TRFO_18123 [Tritrichomonas foetus]
MHYQFAMLCNDSDIINNTLKNISDNHNFKLILFLDTYEINCLLSQSDLNPFICQAFNFPQYIHFDFNIEFNFCFVLNETNFHAYDLPFPDSSSGSTLNHSRIVFDSSIMIGCEFNNFPFRLLISIVLNFLSFLVSLIFA